MRRIAIAHAGVWENGRGTLPDGAVTPPGETGYGRAGTEIEYALARYGYEVEAARSFQNTNGATHVPATVIAVQLPGHLSGVWEGQRTMLVTMFETDTVPAEFHDNIHNYDTVVVPCAENKAAFDRIHDDVHVVPLGVDPERWHFTERPPVTRDRPFTFLCAGAGWHRKGFDLVTDAFMALRDARPATPMRLIVKTQSDLVWDRQPTDPDIVYLKESMTAEAEVDLYADVHCFVSGSRGEGWGLCPHQAIAQGCPTILGDACGQAEFAQWGIAVDCRKVGADYGIWQDTGEWWEPDAAQILARMGEVMDDYEGACATAKDNAAAIAHLTWDNTARHLAQIIGDDPPIARGEWRAFERKLYAIEVTRDMRCNVGGQRYVFKPGETYYEFADVKRILFLCGVLHPDCPTEGLLPEMAAEHASAKETCCPTCGREYPSVVDEAEETLAELAALGVVKA